MFNMWFMINSLNSVLKNHLKLIHKVWDHKRHAPVHSGGSHVSVQLLQFPLSQSFEIHETSFILPQSRYIYHLTPHGDSQMKDGIKFLFSVHLNLNLLTYTKTKCIILNIYFIGNCYTYIH